MRSLPLTFLAGLSWAVSTAYGAVDFDREVRPILSENCFACHGPDAKNRMAGLRLDVADGGALAKGIIVAGNAAQSRLLQRVSAAAPGSRMPPASTGKTLTARQVETLSKWIDEGSKWESHLSFTAPVRREPPVVAGGWAKTPIDNFILARLEKEKLRPSPDS